MRYYLGPWKWSSAENCFLPPFGVDGTLDLGTLPDMAKQADRPGCLCWTNSAVLPADEYMLLAEGDCREIKADGRLRSQWQSLLGYAPKGDTLHEMMFDHLIGGSDPTGQSAAKPLMPSNIGWMDLHLPGHGRVKSERFEWGITPHTAKIKVMLRTEFADLMDAAGKGQLQDPQMPFRVLDMLCAKFHVDDWKEFVPAKLQKDVPGRVPHQTTFSDDFNRADSTGLGANWGAAVEGTAFNVASNKAAPQSATRSAHRWASDLSSADHNSTVDVVVSSGDPRGGPCVRVAAAAVTYYYGWARTAATNNRRVGKIVAGSSTALSTFSLTTFSSGTLKLDINGSTITFYENGSSIFSGTDTSITGNLRPGLMNENASTGTQDNWIGADAVAGGIVFTQLEKHIKGVNRGMTYRWGG